MWDMICISNDICMMSFQCCLSLYVSTVTYQTWYES